MRDYKSYDILTAQAATGTGNKVLVDDFKNVVLSFATDGGGTANLTVKFQGSIQDDVDFSTAASKTNLWSYIEVVDLDNGTPVDGSTGVAVAGADAYKLLEANVNGLKWVCATVTARAAGSVNIKARLFNER